MKKLFLISMSIAILSVTSNAQIEMNSSGQVGIGTSPSSSYDLISIKGKMNTLRLGQYGTMPSGASFYSYGGSSFNGTYASAAISFGTRQYYSSYYTRMSPTVNNVCDLGSSSYAYRYIYTYYVYELSDKRLKENIQNINGALGIVMDLKGVRYDLKKDDAFDESIISNEEEKASRDADRKDNIGFLAQDVYDVIPEVVNYDDSTDIYSVCYTRLIPVLVEAIKEQQAQVESLQSQVTALTSLSSDFKAASTNLEPTLDPLDISSELFQNAPNPFSEETTIKYFLSENVDNAIVYIYDLTGKQLKNYKLSHSGSGELIIFAREFNPGTYLYTLIADGLVIESKQMILTD